MTIQIKGSLTKSRNPKEYNVTITNEVGTIIQVLGDGYCLIKFDQFKVAKKTRLNGGVKFVDVPLEWYVHEIDFYLKQN